MAIQTHRILDTSRLGHVFYLLRGLQGIHFQQEHNFYSSIPFSKYQRNSYCQLNVKCHTCLESYTCQCCNGHSQKAKYLRSYSFFRYGHFVEYMNMHAMNTWLTDAVDGGCGCGLDFAPMVSQLNKCWGGTAGQARYNSSNVGGVTAGQVRHNSSRYITI